ncbi:MAG: insulinase family protein [Xanthomonadales bacterium]|nr:insulinase family protein [Xanthomonadales bacterium]
MAAAAARVKRFACLCGALFAGLMLAPLPAAAWLDLAAAHVEHLQNGMTLIVLEDHSLPVASVQMLYRVGARNETAGATGLAHFLEHMAFRDSANFPDTQLVSSIYAAGGEWHGYTWLDQTTYFATAPKESLDLLLRIEADRMARLEISAADVDVERGAVLTEMHSYENDPASVLQDNVMYLVFLAHPYRNNTIGWESDVAAISHDEIVAFYRQNYHPGNAILAVVGDVNSKAVVQQVNALFAEIPGKPATPLPHTVEPVQNGERRMRLQGELDGKYLKIVYRAPAANSSDYAAFLLAQDILAGGSGVSFLQNDWGTPVRADAPLGQIANSVNPGAGSGGEVSTWFPPSAQDYVFAINGLFAPDADETATESAIEQQIRATQQWLQAGDETAQHALDLARQRVLRELVFDVETTEDAAHQLAFFAGLDALDALQTLPQTVATSSTLDVANVMARYLRSDRRNIAWYVPFAASGVAASGPPVTGSEVLAAAAIEPKGLKPEDAKPQDAKSRRSKSARLIAATNSQPELRRLSNGLPVLLQRSALSTTLSLRVITAGADFPASNATEGPVQAAIGYNQPSWGLSSLGFDVLPDELGAAIGEARRVLESAVSAAAAGATTSPPASDRDPAEVLQAYFSEILGLSPSPGAAAGASVGKTPVAPLLLVLSGDFAAGDALRQLEKSFGDFPTTSSTAPAEPVDARTANTPAMNIESTLPLPVAQVQLGYVVRAPAPGETAAAAWQMALYIFSHQYEGRLGQEAIANRGLIYYIGSDYQTDGHTGWITLDMGVDPDTLPAMQQLFRATLNELVDRPPSQQEVDEARHHLLGRYRSAAQSNAELADRLARDWLWYGQPLTYGELQHRLNAVQRQDIIDLLPAFIGGTTVSILNPPPQPEPLPAPGR